MSSIKNAKKIRGVYENPKGSGIWYVQWFDNKGERHREKAGTRSAAIALKAKRTIDKLEARKLPDKLKFSAGVRFSELCSDAKAQSELHNGESAQKNLQTIIDALADDFGNRLADTITTDDLKMWLVHQRLHRKWEDGTYNHYITQLRVIFRLGRQNGKVHENPALDLKKFDLDNDRPRYLKPSEEERLERVLCERWPQHFDAYLFARNTGLRASAQFSLRWHQIDMHERTLTLPKRSRSKYKKKNWVLPVNSVAYAILERRKTASTRGNDYVFVEYHEGPEYLSIPAYWFPEILEAADIQNFTWHSLRHDFASQLVMRGKDLRTVQQLMCHSSLKQTAKYADLAPSHLREAVEALTVEKPSAIKTATRILELPVSA
jgi:site-specific recombinase XerD